MQTNDTKTTSSAGDWNDFLLPADKDFTKTTNTANADSLAYKTYLKHHEITNLKPGVILEAKVYAKNKYGCSDCSSLFQFSTVSTGVRNIECNSRT